MPSIKLIALIYRNEIITCSIILLLNETSSSFRSIRLSQIEITNNDDLSRMKSQYLKISDRKEQVKLRNRIEKLRKLL